VYFHKITSKKTLSRTHRYLNTTDDNVGLAENFSVPAELSNMLGKLTFSFSKFLLIFIYLLLTVLGQSHSNKPMNNADLLY
jgi:hypothetical protein